MQCNVIFIWVHECGFVNHRETDTHNNIYVITVLNCLAWKHMCVCVHIQNCCLIKSEIELDINWPVHVFESVCVCQSTLWPIHKHRSTLITHFPVISFLESTGSSDNKCARHCQRRGFRRLFAVCCAYEFNNLIVRQLLFNLLYSNLVDWEHSVCRLFGHIYILLKMV